MTTCANCGRLMPDNAASCPNCGALTEFGRISRSQSGEFQQQSYAPPGYSSGYVPPQQGQQFGYNPQQGYVPPQQGQQFGYNPQQGYVPPQQGYYQQQQPNYGQPYQQSDINVTVTNNTTTQSSTPVVVEVLLNIFLGIYGVGWLMAGETTAGIIMLICSFVVYWPLTIAIGIFTLLVGYACWVPLIIAAWIVNAILLNNMLRRKASQVIMVQQRY